MALFDWQSWVEKHSPTSQDSHSTHQLFDLSELGVLQVSGKDSARFLQGQITVDAEKMVREHYRFAAFCTPQGRVTALFTLIRTSDDQFLLLMPKECIEQAQSGLAKYAVFFDATISDVSTDWLVIGNQVSNSSQKHTIGMVRATDQGYSLDWPTESRQVVIVSMNSANEYLQTMNEYVVEPYSNWHCTDLSYGIARLHLETINQWLPHNLNLPSMQGVDFDKGCYTGQEVVARMHYKGKLKTELVYLVGHNPSGAPVEMVPGMNIIADHKKVGQLISYAETESTVHCLVVANLRIHEAKKIHCEQENTPILEVRPIKAWTFSDHSQ